MTEALDTKAKFYRAWFDGKVGNKPRVWSSPEALAASGFDGLVTIRLVGVAGRATYNVPASEAVRATSQDGIRTTFNESMPDEVLIAQGEVMQSVEGIYLRYDTTRGLKMREAMRVAKDAHGVAAVAMLRHWLWPSSFEDVRELLDLYPDHVIEFSSYDRAVGDQPHRNTIIWEVRKY